MRIIGHLDMDAFFAAVEERENPHFAGQPIAVGADPLDGQGRGVLSTANYLARQYGLHSALPVSRAWQLSEQARKSGKPPVIFLPGSYEMYGRVSHNIFAILRKFSPLVEEASIDEAYFDLTPYATFEKAREAARQIKATIKAKEKLTASVGIGPNKLLAKIASDYQKPDGLTAISPAESEGFLENLPLRKIPGIGPKTESVFLARRISQVKHLKNHTIEQLEHLLGKWGRELYFKIRGYDESPLVEKYEAKSIGEQETFLVDTSDPIFLFERLQSLCRHVFGRFQQSEFNDWRTIVLSVRFADFETLSRSHTLKLPTNNLSILEFEAMKLLLPFLDKRSNPKRKLIRLLGIRLEKLG